MIQRKRRQFWWSLRAKPVSGWHVQQFLKIAATISLPYQRYCILDSDIVFFRDFDLARFEYPNPIPLLTMANAVTADQPRHSRWLETSHQLLGLPTPPFPASDFIGHIIFWDQQTTRALTARIEAVTGLGWIEALCRTREFSEYMLYGYFVRERPGISSAARRGRPSTPCVSYWEQPTLEQGRTERAAAQRRQGRCRLLDRVVLRHAGRDHPRRDRRERRSTGAGRHDHRTRGARRAMLIGQASINLTANILSALLGLLSVFIFTRLFSPHDYGVYLLGVGFASVISVFLVGWFRNLILSGHARNDGTDIRGLVISGYLICCLTAPIAYGSAGWSDWIRRRRWPRSCSRSRSACSN